MSSTLTSAPAFSAFHSEVFHTPSPIRAAITAAYRRDEVEAVKWLLAEVAQTAPWKEQTQELAKKLVSQVREKRTRSSGVDALMQEFSLSSEEGVALMCLAEALLRIPDRQTADRLIADKISKGDWRKHLGESPSLFVNAATWGLLITGKLVSTNSENSLTSAITRLIGKGGEPLIRKGVDLAMRMLGDQFVTGQTIDEALDNSRDNEKRGYRYSYDMLGESALTMHDADVYYKSYEDAIHAIGRASNGRGIKDGPGISVKLSALHPRYSRAQQARVMSELLPRLKNLLLLVKRYNIGLNIDAEEADRLELSLDMMEVLVSDADLAGFDGLGFVVQGYQKRCPFVIDYLVDLARRNKRRLMIRLVKGAYWDSEIKRAQVDGLEGYPVYTRKVHTDLSYLACAQKLLASTDVIYPQFATHNAHTLAAIYNWAKKTNVDDYEFQCLHGMGETLYDQVVGKENLGKACRIYAPVGSHQTLLAYLVRRLLENGANSSFVNQIVDEDVSLEKLVADPIDTVLAQGGLPHPVIALPNHIYGSERRNSAGIDLSNESKLLALDQKFKSFSAHTWTAEPILASQSIGTEPQEVRNPADHRELVGHVIKASLEDVQSALNSATDYAAIWQQTDSNERAQMLERAADMMEENIAEFMALAIREAGKSLPNFIAEVREAVDFLRYYAVQSREEAHSQGLGPVVCISPWNFPLAIFIGEVSAALAAGNVVLAKPAEQTSLIAYRAVQLLHEAGVPRAALQFVPGKGSVVGNALTGDARVKGVIFTGSTEVAQLINKTLASRSGVDNGELALIAETGGQNAMIVDSSALAEQVVIDVLSSAFDSAGQRCSALRVLCLQEDIADRTLEMLKGAMQELRIGRPDCLATDIGPVIDAGAQKGLLDHIERMRKTAKSVYQLPLDALCEHGTFVPPTVIEINDLAQLQREVFGPVLHVLRYRRNELPQLVGAINATGYGLTLGVHSRIDETIDFVARSAHVGNIYVNRNIVGAVVGVQPFGGEGKSGTGPKAGGPLYLKRLQKDALLHGDLARSTSSSQTNALVDEMASWAISHGHTKLAAIMGDYQCESLLARCVNLPGPTGERNTLAFAPRGLILCVASDVATLLNQISAAFATGNSVVVDTSTSALLPAGLPKKVRAAIQCSDELDKLPLQAALVDLDTSNAWRGRLADRDGALVPLIVCTENKAIPLWRLVAERALCVNTTAAGGNASLMTISV
ncbi:MULTISPECIES: trifunctional transcriptional regulator/proline dehydrogenase/L-glutamate gamma-semialdehyde dehydrogenase [unclassified Herbaspirillum]|uniref:trifunctional transcriptional regulator/proline dehydrogenase/L-glutamate gamma-semialdehyde dehydrogenase n=1 Tax=unclassified Herbaspirillum TaxID=2624150 RepID=UPI000E2F5FD6|nr:MULTISPECIES: trifunctional transcriptional regulator/proline dehydrogenase/L-glutamate gamma-semialdehyde dehydrogenase [unclassified Herbaspirillum]RFB71331.1 trifunctional transcriptional regulator/proline dehydrogenase/L-glutamate gamma-semialdehyde dehydrogenase [Herbaspirillum sp. 3R-3a1]TFI08288.1 trifunctional transcriptional regulator/proline dehydrogenase/L-glutamate gamma-semialdehyde dehydrogenase [Herbaspirillum sp. 3R11]TFI14703.1 trifunctional transcriptional regulator/proline 